MGSARTAGTAQTRRALLPALLVSLAILTSLAVPARRASAAGDALADRFRNPPSAARPHTWWHWVNGNISREGITADLEAMKRVGIGGAQIFNVDCGLPAGSVPFGSEKWRQS